MFLASRLVYAIRFYPIPKNYQNIIQNAIFGFVNFPNKVITIGQKEMWKIKSNGGCKLVNVQVKSETSKAKWLMEIASKPGLKLHLNLFTEITGVQKGENEGRDLIFMLKQHISHVVKVKSPFYKEALKSVGIFQKRKGIKEVRDWDEESIFYNPLITTVHGNILKETKYFREKGIFKLGQLLEQKSKKDQRIPHDEKAVRLLNIIRLDMEVKKDDMVFLGNKEEVPMAAITQKHLYEDAILCSSKDHIHQTKWVTKLDTLILWEEVWDSVHRFPLTNKTKSAIWEQIHLNFYTQYSYNKWHGKMDKCPLCSEVPESIYHIILHCQFVNHTWTQLQPTLNHLHWKIINDEEKALGIVNIKNQMA